MKPKTESRGPALGLGAVVVLLAASAGVSYHSTRQLREDAGRVAHTHEVLDALNDVRDKANRAEAMQRTYVVTGDDRYLRPFAEATAAAARQVERVRVLTEDNPTQQARLPALEGHVREVERVLARTAAVRKERGFDAARRRVSAGEGRGAVDALRGLVGEMEGHEHDLLRDRQRQSDQAYRVAVATGLVTAALGLASVAAIFGLMGRHQRARRKAAAVVSQQRELLRATLHSVGDGVIATDADGRVTSLNPVAQRLTGWAQEQAQGEPLEAVFRIVNEDTRQGVENPALRALKEGTIVGLANHTLLLAKDGTERPIDDSAAPIRDAGGKLLGAVLVFRDITERRRAERLLAERVRLLRLGAEVGTALTLGGGVRDVLQRCAESVVRNLGAAFARVWTLDEKGGVLELQASAGLYTHLDGPHGRVPVGQFKIGRIAQERQPHLTNAVVGDPLVPEQEWARREGMVAFAGYPLLVEDRLVGVLAMFARHPLSEVTLEALASVADEIALGVQHRRAMQAQRDALAYAESIVDTVREPLVVLDADLRVRTVSRSFCQTFHVTPEQTQGRLLYDLGDRQWDIPALRTLLEEVLPGNTQFNDYEVEHDFPGVGRRVVLLNARRVYREGNHTELILLAVEDVTERRRGEQQRREGERRFRTVIEQVKDYAIFTTDVQGRATSWNEGVRRVLGFDEAEFLGQDVVPAIFTPEDVQSGVAAQELADAAAHGSASDDRWMRKKDGTRFFALGVTTAQRDEAGRLVGFTKVMQNQTDRKRMEDELRRVAADLSEADRRKSEFLAMLAHELRNPLAPIRNALQILRLAGGNGEEVRPAVDMMQRQVGQMVRLIDDLLDVSRISRGKIELKKERVELASVVHHAVEAARPPCEAMGHELTVTLPPEPIHLHADPTRLAQAVGNLLNNACKFTERGGRIRLTVEREGRQVVVRVRDTGIGIAAGQLPLIFEMFTQVDASRERSQGGLGIGLTLVRRLVEMHDGTVEAHSAGVGRGSEFVVRLPVFVAPPAPPPPEPSAAKPAETVARRILIVDDNRDAADSLAMLLRLSGHEVHTAHDGLEAVAAAAKVRPDVILLDIGLPKLNGYEAARQIRQQREGGVVLVALTGWGQEEDRRRSVEAGFDAHMVKPVDLAALERLLEQPPAPG